MFKKFSDIAPAACIGVMTAWFPTVAVAQKDPGSQALRQHNFPTFIRECVNETTAAPGAGLIVGQGNKIVGLNPAAQACLGDYNALCASEFPEDHTNAAACFRFAIKAQKTLLAPKQGS